MQPLILVRYPGLGCYSDQMEEEPFGQRLRHIRQERHIGQRALAAAVHRSKTWLVHLETGQRWQGKLPPLDDLRALARALSVSVDELVGPEHDLHGEATPDEPIEAVLDRIGAWSDADDDDVELDQAVAAGRRGGRIPQGADDRGRSGAARRRYVVRIDGDCLLPEAKSGDYAVFYAAPHADIGEVVVVADGEQALIKYLDEQDGVQYLMPHVGEPVPLQPGMRIVGVVDHFRRKPGRPPRMRRDTP